MPNNILNKYFDKIFVINLADNISRWKGVEKQFSHRGIKIERFIGIDGRCKNEGRQQCLAKLKTFEMIYNVRIPLKRGQKLQSMVPAASLTIGTILLLRAMVKNNWKRILICEDDIYLAPGFIKKFNQGINEIGKYNWDILYLGCGAHCGRNGVSWEKTKRNKHTTPWYKPGEDKWYVSHPNDLRSPCEHDECSYFSKHISHVAGAGGTWCYAYSLKGAKKC